MGFLPVLLEKAKRLFQKNACLECRSLKILRPIINRIRKSMIHVFGHDIRMSSPLMHEPAIRSKTFHTVPLYQVGVACIHMKMIPTIGRPNSVQNLPHRLPGTNPVRMGAHNPICPANTRIYAFNRVSFRLEMFSAIENSLRSNREHCMKFPSSFLKIFDKNRIVFENQNALKSFFQRLFQQLTVA